MPLLTVTGAPIAPVGKTLASATLAVRFLETYADGVYSYPRLHEAVLSADKARWETQAGDPFTLPGSSLYSYLATPCVLVEKHTYEGGETQFFERGPLRIVETSPGQWHYATPDRDALIATTADAPSAQALLTSQLGQPGGVAQLGSDGLYPLAGVNGLQEALSGKAAQEHSHSVSEVNGLTSALAGKAGVNSAFRAFDSSSSTYRYATRFDTGLLVNMVEATPAYESPTVLSVQVTFLRAFREARAYSISAVADDFNNHIAHTAFWRVANRSKSGFQARFYANSQNYPSGAEMPVIFSMVGEAE